MKITSRFLPISRPAVRQAFVRTGRVAILAALVLPISSLLAQSAQFTSRDLTGTLELVATVNVSELAKTRSNANVSTAGPEINPNRLPILRPPIRNSGQPVFSRVPPTPRVAAPAVFRGFDGLTHLDQRTARNGNQFSVEPPDQALAVGNGFVLEAINSALNVYDTNGVQLIERPLALTEFFDLPPSINRTTGALGVFAGDVVSLFDKDTNRWFVLAWAQLNKSDGTPLAQSRIFFGVSQTSDPTGVFTIYTLDTTDASDPDEAGPRIPDFPHIGLDRHGFFISVNEFAILPTGGFSFIDAAIFAISKQDLVTGSGGAHPGVTRLALPFNTGFEFTVFPANTPPGSSPFLGNGGAEFFVSAHFVNNTEHSLAVWALTNTKSLDTIPALGLQKVAVNTQAFNFPSKSVDQKDGFRPLGASLNAPLETLDPGDFRVLSVVYSAGRLWATLGSEVTDANGDQRMAAAFFALSPKIVSGKLSASRVTQGVIAETGVNLLRPAIAVNKNKGGMVFTLVGPNDFPSSAFVPINGVTAGAINIARAGNEPEDGFTGYAAFGGNGTARWGDYAAAGVDADGSIWMATEFTPDLARTSLANWSTYITRLQP